MVEKIGIRIHKEKRTIIYDRELHHQPSMSSLTLPITPIIASLYLEN